MSAAIPEFEKAIGLAPGEPTFICRSPRALEKVGAPADARREYEQYLEMAPTAADADTVRAHLQGPHVITGSSR